MSIKEQLTIAAGIAVALASTALFPVFGNGTWFYEILGAILCVVVTGLITRRLGLPRGLQPVAALVVVVAYLLLDFASTTLSHGIPTGSTLPLLQHLVDQGQSDISTYGPPVPAHQGIVLLTVSAVAGVAILVDLVAVVLDRAAVAGLPLLLLLAVPSAVLPGGIGGLPFVLGAIGWLGLLLVEGSERVGRWGTPMRSALPGAKPGGDDSSLGRVGRRIGFSAVVLAVLVPLAPGLDLDHRLIGGGSGAGAGKGSGPNVAKTFNPITKLSDQLNLTTPVELLQYDTTDTNPDYIRMTTLDTYHDGTWMQTRSLEADQKRDQVQKGIPLPAGESGARDGFTMNVQVTNLDVKWLPLPYGPTKVDINSAWLWEKDSQTAFSAKRSTKKLPTYHVEASRVTPDRTALQSATLDDIDPTVQQIYNSPIKVAPFVTDTVAAVLKGKTTEYDEAVALQDYFSPAHGFVYTTKTSEVSHPTGKQDALEAFLKGKHGFCEQYATAMAAMLRVAGIPSRVAVGFTPGLKIPDAKGAYYSVTTKEAHAWPEAWFAGTGWVRFEPTPAANEASVPSYATAAVAPVGPGPSANPTPTGGPTPTSTRFANGGKLITDPTITAKRAVSAQQGSSVSVWLVAPIIAAVLLVAPFLLTALRRRRRKLHPGALTSWDQLTDDATDVGYHWLPSDSPRAAATRLLGLRRLPTPAAEALLRIASAAEQVRYAPPDRPPAGDLTPDVLIVRSALQSLAPARVRLRAVLFPPSTLRWASEGLGDRLSRVLDGFDDAISAVTRPLRRRTAPR